MRRTFIISPFPALAAALVVAATLALPARAFANDAEFFFYSPQVGTGNLSLLKEAAESHFRASRLRVRFQPFARPQDLEQEFARRQPAFLIVPGWVARSGSFTGNLRPLARPLRGGRTIDRRALMARSGVGSAADIANGSIASTVPSTESDQASRALVKFRDEHPSIRVIPVPKDVDALLAVGFGQVDAAFVSIAQFEMLSRVNPTLTRDLHEIGYSEEAPLPLIYATTHAPPELVGELGAALLQAHESETGKRFNALLGYDRWELADEPQAISSVEPEVAP